MRRLAWPLLILGALTVAGCAVTPTPVPRSLDTAAMDAAKDRAVESMVMSDTYVHQGTGPGQVDLPRAPVGATAVRVRFTCLSGGTYSWGPNPAQAQQVGCITAEEPKGGWYDFSLWSNPRTFTVAGPATGEWAVSAVYVAQAGWGWVFDSDGVADADPTAPTRLDEGPATVPGG